jgi:hypothetical protein
VRRTNKPTKPLRNTDSNKTKEEIWLKGYNPKARLEVVPQQNATPMKLVTTKDRKTIRLLFFDYTRKLLSRWQRKGLHIQ